MSEHNLKVKDSNIMKLLSKLYRFTQIKISISNHIQTYCTFLSFTFSSCRRTVFLPVLITARVEEQFGLLMYIITEHAIDYSSTVGPTFSSEESYFKANNLI